MPLVIWITTLSTIYFFGAKKVLNQIAYQPNPLILNSHKWKSVYVFEWFIKLNLLFSA